MAMNGAWPMFFCAACQRERPIAEKVRMSRNLTKCRDCAEKKRPVGRKPRLPDFDSYEAEDIPSSVMDSYREALE